LHSVESASRGRRRCARTHRRPLEASSRCRSTGSAARARPGPRSSSRACRGCRSRPARGCRPRRRAARALRFFERLASTHLMLTFTRWGNPPW
jgi:hypothetical protein